MPESHAPYRADEVGSLLRTAPLKEARARREKGEITPDQLKAVEDEEIRKIIRKQEDVGLQLATDGEFRRSWWHFDFFWHLTGCERVAADHGIQFHGVQTKAESLKVTGKLDFPADHPMLEHFKFLKANTKVTPKMTIPSPSVMPATSTTRPFRIGRQRLEGDASGRRSTSSTASAAASTCPGSHGIDHLDWFATLGDQRIAMSGGWHDAGDLSQGVINTGEATYSMFALAERLRARGDDPALVARLIEEAKWGLDWVLRVRFPGGYRMAFASHNLWTNNIVGDADDRTREAKNNPNANYIAAAAEAIAYRVLKDERPRAGGAEPAHRRGGLALRDRRASKGRRRGTRRRSPRRAWSSPASASRRRSSCIARRGTAEVRRQGRRARAGDRRVAAEAPRRAATFPLAGFFYTGPDRDTLFHQFHRGNDQAPIVALAQLVEALPDHADWMKWYSTRRAVCRVSEAERDDDGAVRRAAGVRLSRRR